MSNHYSDYVKKSVSIKELKFDKVQESDKEVLKKARSVHIKKNIGFLIVMSIGFVAGLWYFINFLIVPAERIGLEIISVALLGALVGVTGYFIFSILGPVSGIRRGVVITANRVQEVKDNRNATYQYVFDIYFEDTDEALMSYTVDKEAFASILPGDGVILCKIGRSVKVLADPERKGVMDVSHIKSGV